MSVENKGIHTGASHGPERGPYLRYPCRDSEEIYELYDDVELTDSSPSPKGKGLLAAGWTQPAWALGTYLLQGPFLPFCSLAEQGSKQRGGGAFRKFTPVPDGQHSIVKPG